MVYFILPFSELKVIDLKKLSFAKERNFFTPFFFDKQGF
jgi:hypothetical protein